MDVVSLKEVITVAVSGISAVLGAMWWLSSKVVSGQKKLLDAQFAAQSAHWKLEAQALALRMNDLERRLGEEIDATKKLAVELAKLHADLPTRFVIRDDFLRFSGSFGEQMAALHRKLDDIIRGDYARRSD